MVLNENRSKAVLYMLTLLIGLAIISGCTNPLVEAVKAVQVKSISPHLSITVPDGSALTSGGNLEFSDVSIGATKPIDINLINTGKTDLTLTVTGITVTMGTGTEANSFILLSSPPVTIEAGASAELSLGFFPSSTGAKTATVVIPTNDADNSMVTFTLSGIGMSTGKDITTFSLANLVPKISQEASSIVLKVPVGTNVKNLVAVFTLSDKASATVNGIAQTSNVTQNDFSSDVVYTITAEDGTTKNYTITVIIVNTEPLVSATSAIGSITTTTATAGGTISSNGGSAITISGICWSASQNPDIDTCIAKTTTGPTSLGSWSNSSMSALSPGTTYFVCAYATNLIGTGYGAQVSFTTLPVAPATPSVATVRGPAGTGKLDVSWPPVTGAVVYEVYCDTTTTRPSTTATGGTDISGVSCTLTNLTNYANHYVWVVAKGVSGESQPSPISSATMVGVPVTSMTLSKTTVKVWPGSSETVTVTYGPSDATLLSANWSSGNTSRVSVSGGTVTGVGGDTATPTAAAGVATITATPADGQTTVACTVTVTNTLFVSGGTGPAGGILFYDSLSRGSKGWRYLEAGTSNVGSGHTWAIGASGLIPGAGGTDVGTGKTNTDAIVAFMGSGNYFAYDCRSYSLGAYTDWFMPSRYELNALLSVIPSIKVQYTFIYTSTQTASNGAIAYRVETATWPASFTNYTGGGDYYITRPVRQF